MMTTDQLTMGVLFPIEEVSCKKRRKVIKN